MPFFNHNILEKDNVWVWEIKESEKQLIKLLNNEDVHLQLEKYKSPSRRLQFLASRVLINHVFNTSKTEKSKNGKPFINDTKYHFSITHDKIFAGLIKSEINCGIDIQEITDKTVTIRHKFVNEHDIYCDSSDKKHLTFLWCAKEALYKINGEPEVFFKDHMIISKSEDPSVFIGTITHEKFKSKHRLKIHEIENYCLVYTLN